MFQYGIKELSRDQGLCDTFHCVSMPHAQIHTTPYTLRNFKCVCLSLRC